jgi:hypothetical protein
MFFVADLVVCSKLNCFMSAVAFKPVAPRLRSGFLVWLLYMVPVAPIRMVWRVCGVQVSKALAASLCCARAFPAPSNKLVGRGRVNTALSFDQMYGWLVVSWFHSQWVRIGRAISP